MKSTVLIVLFFIGSAYSRSVPSFLTKLEDESKATAACNPSFPPKRCGHSMVQARIVGGNLAEKDEWPWQAYLVMTSSKDNKQFSCGGSIISDQWILTAAHCLVDEGPLIGLRVTVGDYILDELEGSEQLVDVDRWCPHYSYCKEHFDFDVALIKLKNPLKFSKHIQPICLPEEDYVFDAGNICTATGWGNRTQQKRNIQETGLYEVELPLVDQQTCLQSSSSITDNMICAGSKNGGIDTCSGDSGGPLACKRDGAWYEVGITSWGNGCARPGSYGVYANVIKFLPWIKETIASEHCFAFA